MITFGKTSTKTALAPRIKGACAVEIQLILGIITSSPGFIPIAIIAINNAILPFVVRITYGTSKALAIFSSNSFETGP